MNYNLEEKQQQQLKIRALRHYLKIIKLKIIFHS